MNDKDSDIPRGAGEPPSTEEGLPAELVELADLEAGSAVPDFAERLEEEASTRSDDVPLGARTPDAAPESPSREAASPPSSPDAPELSSPDAVSTPSSPGAAATPSSPGAASGSLPDAASESLPDEAPEFSSSGEASESSLDAPPGESPSGVSPWGASRLDAAPGAQGPSRSRLLTAWGALCVVIGAWFAASPLTRYLADPTTFQQGRAAVLVTVFVAIVGAALLVAGIGLWRASPKALVGLYLLVGFGAVVLVLGAMRDHLVEGLALSIFLEALALPPVAYLSRHPERLRRR